MCLTCNFFSIGLIFFCVVLLFNGLLLQIEVFVTRLLALPDCCFFLKVFLFLLVISFVSVVVVVVN